jgi:hypothetical protein
MPAQPSEEPRQRLRSVDPQPGPYRGWRGLLRGLPGADHRLERAEDLDRLVNRRALSDQCWDHFGSFGSP